MEPQNRYYYNCSVNGCLNSTLNYELSFFNLPVVLERMDKYIYHRVYGSIVTLVVTVVYTYSTAIAMQKELLTHPELKIYNDLGPRYNTVWNMVFLWIYQLTALICDISTVMRQKSDRLSLTKFRLKLFHVIVLPQVLGMLPFWPIYFYDRELVFPTAADIIVPTFGNFVFHGLGMFYVYWELIYLPKDAIKRSDVTNIYLLALHGAYTLVLLYTRYVDLGVWIYDVLTAVEGTIFLPMLVCGLPILSHIFFYVQWYVKDYVWKLRTYKEE